MTIKFSVGKRICVTMKMGLHPAARINANRPEKSMDNMQKIQVLHKHNY